MTQMDEKGYNHPTKVFPCECGMGGVMVTIEEDEDFLDCDGAPFLGISFWEMRAKLESRAGLTRWERVKYAWHILRGGSPWANMVWMRAEVAKKLANHITYVLNRAKKPTNPSKLLVDWPKNGKPVEDKEE